MSTKPQNVCVLANRFLLRWEVEALERMVEEAGVDITLTVVNTTDELSDDGSGRGKSDDEAEAFENPTSVQPSDVKLFARMLPLEGAWSFVLAERKLSWILGQSEPRLMQRQPVDEVACLSGADTIRCEPISAGGHWNELPDEVVDRIVSETDVVVRFGFGLLTGRIIEEPEYGVLSFHAADIREYRGLGPPQMFLNDEERGGATLQQLTDDVDGGRIVEVRSLDISDANTLDDIRTRINELQIPMLAAGIKQLQDPSFSPDQPERLGQYNSTSKRRNPLYASRVLLKNIAGRLRSWLM